MITLGIDIGSISTKVIALKDGKINWSNVRLSGYNAKNTGDEILEDMESKGFGPTSISGIVATGYGRNAVSFADKTVTEITCHAAGVHFLAPEIRSIIDIGGQDSKAIEQVPLALPSLQHNDCAAEHG